MDSAVIVNPICENITLRDYTKETFSFWTETLGILSKNGGSNPTDSLIGWTINLPYDTPVIVPEVFIRRSGSPSKRERKIKYKDCTPYQQIKYLIDDYLPKVVTPLLDRGIGIFEVTKQGMIHVHIAAVSEGITDKIDLITLQRTVSQLLLVRKLTKGVTRQGTCNYIHFVSERDKWIEYLEKEQSSKLQFFTFLKRDV